MKTVGIPLGGRNGTGRLALIDEIDAIEVITERWWFAMPARRKGFFYAMRGATPEEEGRRWIQMHRVIMNAPHGLFVDHISGNGLDNRRCNLRLATNSQNVANQRKGSRGHPRYKGITQRPSGKWSAQISTGHGRGAKFLGSFDTPEEAAEVYDMEAVATYGQFALTNAMIIAGKTSVPPPIIDYVISRPKRRAG
jgi:hypothetical protein